MGATTKGVVTLIDPFFGLVTREQPILRQLLLYPREVLDCDTLILRGMPAGVLDDFGTTREELSTSFAQERGSGTRIGYMSWVESGDVLPRLTVELAGESEASKRVLARELRSLELHANLIRSRAIHTATSAHFRLPSGAHSDKFIRVADAFDSDFSVARLADWLQHLLTPNTIIVADTWTLMPLLLELRHRAKGLQHSAPSFLTEERGLPIIVFGGYPSPRELRRTRDELDTLIYGRSLAHVLVLLSVVSSGNLLENLRSIVTQRDESVPVTVIAMVNASSQGHEQDSFVHLKDILQFAVQRGKPCSLCADPLRHATVSINAKRYAEDIEPRYQAQMLTGKFAEIDRAFWELADRADCVQLHVREPSMNRHLEIWVDVPRLLMDPEWKGHVKKQLRRTVPHCDLLVVPRNHATSALKSLARELYGENLAVVVCDRDGSADVRKKLRSKLAGKRSILMLDDVVMRGGTIRMLHRLVQDVIHGAGDDERPDPEYSVAAFVVVARPEFLSVWERLESSLQQESRAVTLDCAHFTLLPDDREVCPWCRESDALDRALHETTRRKLGARSRSGIIGAIESRRRQLEVATASSWKGMQGQLFYCAPDGTMLKRPADRLTPHSYFGERLREHVAYCAVASAMQRIRDDIGRQEITRRGDVWFWDLTKIMSAYHDPILHASFLRCTRSAELRVPSGRGVRSTLQTIMPMSGNAAFRQSSMLAAEHLLTVALNKYPIERIEEIARACWPVVRNNGGMAKKSLPAILVSESPDLGYIFED